MGKPKTEVVKTVVGPDPSASAREAVTKQGSDLAIVKKALEDSTSIARNLWISFITFGTYLIITISGVDHKQLFLAKPIKLPVLNADLPLVTFFWVVPILFVIFHLYLLLNLKLLADQVHGFEKIIVESGAGAVAIEQARLQLPNFIIVQILAGTTTQRHSAAGALLSFTALLTLVIAPTILILFAQLVFLPYHSHEVTNVQRLTLVVDLVLVWYFWIKIRGRRPERWVGGAGAVASVVAVYLSFYALIFPGERYAGPLARMLFVETGSALDEYNEIDYVSENNGWFYNTLFLPDFRAVDPEFFNKTEIGENERTLDLGDERSIDLRNRDFRYANFDRIDLRRADLSGTKFDWAVLNNASLNAVSLFDASLQNASLLGARLQNAVLTRASLQGASFDRASLQGASLYEASLQGASLYGASLQGATLDNASLQGATLDNASLQGVTLDSALLHGASLVGASLQGASLVGASLQGAELDKASVQGASLSRASLQGVSLYKTVLLGTSLAGAKVWRSRSEQVFRYGNNLTGLNIEFDLSEAKDGDFERNPDPYQELLVNALSGVPERIAGLVRERLAVLDPAASEPNGTINWRQAMDNGTSISIYQSSLATVLDEIACDRKAAPLVASGILVSRYLERRSRLEDTGPAAVNLIKKMLDPTTMNCPGAIGLEERELEDLRRLRVKLEADYEKR